MNDQQLRACIKNVYSVNVWFKEKEVIPEWNEIEESVIRFFSPIILEVSPELTIEPDESVFCHFTITSTKNAEQVFEAVKILQIMAREAGLEFNVE